MDLSGLDKEFISYSTFLKLSIGEGLFQVLFKNMSLLCNFIIFMVYDMH